jgi:hypothetical protein
MSKERERIVSAAIKDKDTIYTGKSHAQIIGYMVSGAGLPKPITGDQGFYTSSGRFVDRDIAAKIALYSGQMRERHGYLLSEDVEDMPEQEVKEVLDKH